MTTNNIPPAHEPSLNLLGRSVRFTANWLDETRPGWETEIDLDILNMGHMFNCVGGQLRLFNALNWGLAFPGSDGHRWETLTGRENPDKVKNQEELLKDKSFRPFLAFLDDIAWYSNPKMVNHATKIWLEEINKRL